jgi:hypothetical protein
LINETTKIGERRVLGNKKQKILWNPIKLYICGELGQIIQIVRWKKTKEKSLGVPLWCILIS